MLTRRDTYDGICDILQIVTYKIQTLRRQANQILIGRLLSETHKCADISVRVVPEDYNNRVLLPFSPHIFPRPPISSVVLLSFSSPTGFLCRWQWLWPRLRTSLFSLSEWYSRLRTSSVTKSSQPRSQNRYLLRQQSQVLDMETREISLRR